MLSSELEICLNEAFQSAREARHEFMTVEHLLLAIVDTPKVREILRACGADVARLRKDLKAEITVTGSSMPAMFDVLVRPEDLPTAATAGKGADPWAREPDAREPASAVLGDVPPTDAPDTVLCERPWDRAWEIVSLLGEQGIQAAILPNEESTTAPSIDSGMFRVGVRAHDLERAQGLIES